MAVLVIARNSLSGFDATVRGITVYATVLPYRYGGAMKFQMYDRFQPLSRTKSSLMLVMK